MTATDTVLWSTPQMLAWIRRHLDEGHTLRGRDADADDSPAGRFTCSCGVTLDVRPLLSSDVSAGVHVVTGPMPLDPPQPPPGLLQGAADRATVAEALRLLREDPTGWTRYTTRAANLLEHVLHGPA